MRDNDQQINKFMIIGWAIIVGILVCAYFGEYLKGTRSGSYMVMFYLVTALPMLACLLLHISGKAVHSLLHDIGKIGIPDAVLKKPGQLDKNEFGLMKQHVIIGAQILKDCHMIEDLDIGARYHHEKYDGTGYAKGLKGDEIPEVARIIGLADAYDAMTSDRVYRKSMPDKAVLSELRKNSGSQFDPNITEVFIKMLEENRIEQLFSKQTF